MLGSEQLQIEVKPNNSKTGTQVTIVSKMYDETIGGKVKTKLVFKDVAGIDFRVNYIDSFIGCEAFGLFCFDDKDIILEIMHDIFRRRKEIYLLEGDYDYDEEDEADVLNIFDLDGKFSKKFDQYKAMYKILTQVYISSFAKNW